MYVVCLTHFCFVSSAAQGIKNMNTLYRYKIYRIIIHFFYKRNITKYYFKQKFNKIYISFEPIFFLIARL